MLQRRGGSYPYAFRPQGLDSPRESHVFPKDASENISGKGIPPTAGDSMLTGKLDAHIYPCLRTEPLKRNGSALSVVSITISELWNAKD